MKRQRSQGANGSSSVLGLDFGKYLLSRDKRVTMDSDITTGTESDTSDLEPGMWSTYLPGNRTSENSEDSDDYRGYFDDGRRLPGVYDTSIDNADDTYGNAYQKQRGQKRGHEDEHDIKIRQAIAQLNAPISNDNFGRPLYSIRETASLVSESSGSVNDNSDSNSSTPVHRPVYGRYQKLTNQNDHFISSSNQDSDDSDSLETLILHRLPGENLGMILGIEGGKDSTGKVSSVLVKSVTLGGAAYRATGSSKGVCVSDEILKVNGTDLRTLSHDECISVFKDMPLRVLLGIKRGQKNLPPVEISPNEAEKIDRKFDFQRPVPAGSVNRQDFFDSDEETMSGFGVYKVTIEKEPNENLGLSIVPSYGSTKEFYQIKRILPSGAAAHSGQLQVGDRLITCNGHSLQRLTQNHCLNILKSASSKGDVDLEVIRPLDNGSSMEISVTLNNNNQKIRGFEPAQLSGFDNTHPKSSAFDPSQYSLKTQSYDRHVDVIVTSESEDYLTLSEDDYSRTERLANIPEAEANELFASNSFKLAYKKPFNAIEEVSSENDTQTETETETESVNPQGVISGLEFPYKEVDIVNLDVNTSPYHIPKRPLRADSAKENKRKINDNSERIPASNLDEVTSPSYSGCFKSQNTINIHHPKTDIDSLSAGSATSPRNSILSNSDRASVKSENSSVSSPRSPRENITNIVSHSSANTTPLNTPYLHPRQQVPVSEIDEIGQVTVSTDIPDIGEIPLSELREDNTEIENCYYPGFSSGIVGIEFPENHIYIGADRTLYTEEDFELNDSDKYFRPLSDSDNEIETALPPPVEFSDSNNFTGSGISDSSQVQIIPVTNIDDFANNSSSVEVSPVHEGIEIISSEQEYPEAELAKLEASLRDLEEASSDKPNSVPDLATVHEDLDSPNDTSLPLNYEVTINSQNISYKPEIYYTTDIQTLAPVAEDFEVTVNNQSVPYKQSSVQHISANFHDTNEVLQVVKDSEDGAFVITQFDPEENHNTEFQENYYNNNSTMDITSEAMLKDALDIEYDMIPDSDKFRTRIILGDGEQYNEDAELDDTGIINQNIVAESLAQEMIKTEQNNYGYYMESDEEPDEVPDEDLPANPPDLPDIPPPVLTNFNLSAKHDDVVTSSPGLSVRLSPTPAKSNKTEVTINDSSKLKQTAFTNIVEKDSNWTFRVKIAGNIPGMETDDRIDPEQEIIPKRIERKSEFPVHSGFANTDNDTIVPVKVDRKYELPFKNMLKNETGEIAAPQSEVIIQPKATVTVQSVKSKPPPVAPKPSPRKVNENKALSKNVAVIELKHNEEYDNRSPVNEPIVEPTVAKKDKSKSVLTHNDECDNRCPVDEPVVEPTVAKKDKSKSVLNVVRIVGALNDSNILKKQSTPPKEVAVKTILSGIDKRREQQSPPPVQDTIIVEKRTMSPKRVAFSKNIVKHIDEKREHQSPPPIQDTVVVEKQTLHKSMQGNISVTERIRDIEGDKQIVSVTDRIRNIEGNNQKLNTKETKTNDVIGNRSPVTFKTQIKLTKDNGPKEVSDAAEVKTFEEPEENKTILDKTEVSVSDIPRLDLDSVSSSESGSLSPKSDKSGDLDEKHIEPDEEKAYKTTIGVTNMDSSSKDDTPVPEVKPLSQIKPLSFNPKSLTIARPVQYKTTINTLGSKPSGLSVLGRSSLKTQKAEHPIKRMETLPFEVSILKGILGIGIKTQMTPEGFVQVTEILPSGPVGREGNIKVGDYLLSINNTELTGLTDGKVQQILRLLPRGLSKIVASAVPPEETSTDTKPIQEKKESLPRASVPLAAPRQPTFSAAQKSATLPSAKRQVNIIPPKQPVISTKSLPFSSKPNASQSDQTQHKSESPLYSKSLSPALSPRKQSPLASPRSPDISASSPVVSPRTDDMRKSSETPPPVVPKAPLHSPKSLSPALSPRKQDVTSKSTVEATVLPDVSASLPVVSPRKDEISVNSSARPPSPVASRNNDSSKSSPRTPPPVAPKPKKRGHSGDATSIYYEETVPRVESPVKDEIIKTKRNSVEESEPIETEIFASISGPKSEHIPSPLTGPNILPGAITYDYVTTKDKTDWVPGKVDVVESTSSQNITESELEQAEAPQHESPVHLDIVKDTDTDPNISLDHEVCDDSSNILQSNKEVPLEQPGFENEVRENLNDTDLKESESSTNNEYHFRALEHIDDFVEQVEPTKQRSLSVSSDSSYTEFNECNVEDESNLEEIIEENDVESGALKIIDVNEELGIDNIPEHKSAIENKDNINEQNMEAYRSMAEHIVANVIASVQNMDLLEIHKGNDSESSKETHEDFEIDNAEYSEFPTNLDEPPALPETEAPPLPMSPCPVTEMVTSDNISLSYSAPVSQSLVEDVEESSQISQMHAEMPINVVPSVDTLDNAIDIEIKNTNVVYSQEIPDLEEQGEYTDDFENDSSDNDEYREHRITYADSEQTGMSVEFENPDDQSIDVVVFMQADMEKSAVHDTNLYTPLETDANNKEIPSYVDYQARHHIIENKDSINDETESIETKSLTSSDDMLSDGDIVENHNDSISQSAVQPDIKKSEIESQKTESEAANLNGFSIVAREVERLEKIKSDRDSDKANSSFSSDSAMSPVRSGTPHSDDDQEHERGIRSPEVDRMIRLLSLSDEPQHEGEGEVIEVKMNKGVTGLGFVIQGGKASPKGDQPISVKRIFKGGPADQSGQLKVNDVILDVNGEDLSNMRHSDAWQHLKFLPSGEITMKIRRYSSASDD